MLHKRATLRSNLRAEATGDRISGLKLVSARSASDTRLNLPRCKWKQVCLPHLLGRVFVFRASGSLAPSLARALALISVRAIFRGERREA